MRVESQGYENVVAGEETAAVCQEKEQRAERWLRVSWLLDLVV